MTERAEVVVVGAGVVGLTTAIVAAEAGMRVRSLTTLPPAETTSVLATAMVGPTFGFGGPSVDAWEHVTVREVRAHADAPGVSLQRGLFVSRLPGMVPPNADQLPQFALVDASELPAGYETGFRGEVPMINMPPYLEYLRARFEAAGGVIERIEPLVSIAGARNYAALVVNCTGLAARDLVPDPAVFPLRGPKIVVRNPGLDTFVIEGPPGPQGTSMHPHGDIVVLGGSSEVSDDTTPDPDELAAIIDRCAALDPRIRDAEVLEHRVGLRPGRESIRLEAEDIDGGRIVHNYGHMGIGVGTSWGCTRDAFALLTK